MATFEKQFQQEISRLSRKALKAELERLRKEHADLRKTVLQLKRRVAALEAVPAKTTTPGLAPEGATDNARFTGRGIRQLRQRLNITQAELARLAGVTSQSVYQWERQEGLLTLRNTTRAALLAVKRLSSREVRAQLDHLQRP